MNIPPLGTTSMPAPTQAGVKTSALREKATELEAAFLAEMLQFAGLGTASDSFGGGIGEEQFSSFLRQEQAGLMAERGGIGLAQALFDAMIKQGATGEGAT